MTIDRINNEVLLLKRLVLSSTDVHETLQLTKEMLDRNLFVDGDSEWDLLSYDQVYRACI